MRKIKYKNISPELEKLVKPGSTTRSAIGFDKNIGEYYYMVLVDLIPFKHQARKHFSEEEIKSLASSIKLHGIRNPLTIIASKEFKDKYEVVSGERRLRAAKLLNLEKLPCIIIGDMQQAEEVALIENIHRLDLHPIELGIALKNILNKKLFNSQAEMSEKLSIKESVISEHLKFAELEEKIQTELIENNIRSRDALRKILKLKEANKALVIKSLIKNRTINNFSILRFMYTDRGIKIQKEGIKKLSVPEKDLLISYLKDVIKEIQN